MNVPDPDIHQVWRAQPREEYQMSVDTIRLKAEQLERRVRNMNRTAAALFAALILVEAWQIWRSPEMLERVGDLLTIAAVGYVALRFRGHETVESMPAGLGLTGSVDFYRAQLARRRDLSGHPWRFLLPFVPGVGLSLLGGAIDGPPAQTVAVAAFGVALFLILAWLERRRTLKLQREIDELA